MAQMADSMKKPNKPDGYEAQRHALRPDLVVVWAPCGCYWVSDGSQSFITCCQLECCDLSLAEVERALLALAQAEESLKGTPVGPPGPRLVEKGPNGVEEAVDQMISEGGPVDPSVPPLSEGTE